MLVWRVFLDDDAFFGICSADRREQLEEIKRDGNILELALATLAQRYTGDQAMVLENVLRVTLVTEPYCRATGFEAVLELLTGEETESSRY